MNNIFQFVNLSCRWLEKVYKGQFHLFSVLEQQDGLISILVLSHYNLSPSGFSIFLGVNRTESPHVEERTKNCLAELNHEPYCLFHQHGTHIIFMIQLVLWWMKFVKISSILGMILFHIVCVYLWISSNKLEWLWFLFTLLPNHLWLVLLIVKQDQLICSASCCIGFMILLSTCLIG